VAKQGEINFLAPQVVPGASACTPDVQDQQTAYFTMLAEVTNYTVSGAKMQMTSSTGTTLFFEALP